MGAITVVVDLRTYSKNVKSFVTTFPSLLLRLHYPHHPRVIRHRTVPATIVVRVMLLPVVRGTIVVPNTIHPQNTTHHTNTTHRHHRPTPCMIIPCILVIPCMRKNRNVIPHRTVQDPPAVRVIRLCTAVATIAVHVIPPRPVNRLVGIVVPEQNFPVKNATKFVNLSVAAAAIMVARVVRVDTTADMLASVVMITYDVSYRARMTRRVR